MSAESSLQSQGGGRKLARRVALPESSLEYLVLCLFFHTSLKITFCFLRWSYRWTSSFGETRVCDSGLTLGMWAPSTVLQNAGPMAPTAAGDLCEVLAGAGSRPVNTLCCPCPHFDSAAMVWGHPCKHGFLLCRKRGDVGSGRVQKDVPHVS